MDKPLKLSNLGSFFVVETMLVAEISSASRNLSLEKMTDAPNFVMQSRYCHCSLFLCKFLKCLDFL